MQQSARPTGLAGPPHQTHTHLGRAHTLAQASVHLSHSKSPGLPNDQSVNQSILVHSTALAQYLSLLSLLSSFLPRPPPPLINLLSAPPSCPLNPPLPPDTRSLVEGALDTPTTPSLIRLHTTAAQCGGPWSHPVPPNPGA